MFISFGLLRFVLVAKIHTQGLDAVMQVDVGSGSRSGPSALSIALVLGAFVAAWGGLFLSREGVFWDDWILVDTPNSDILTRFRVAGIPWFGGLHVLFAPFGPMAYTAVSLGVGSLTGLGVLTVLHRTPGLSADEALSAALVFVTMPLFAARHAMIVLPYTLSIGLLFAGWILMLPSRRSTAWRRLRILLALVLLSAAALIPSVALFIIVPLMHVVWTHRQHEHATFGLVHAGLMLTVIVAQFLVLRAIYPTSGLYASYNSIDRGLLLAAIAILGTVGTVGVIALKVVPAKLIPALSLAIAGGALVGLGLLPYVAVGHFPPYTEWSTRHELLVPFGLSVATIGGMRLLALAGGRELAFAGAASVVVLSAIASTSITRAYAADWSKQEALMEQFAGSAEVHAAAVILFVDETVDDNIFSRNYRFYEWNGLLRRAFGESTRFGVGSYPELELLLAGQWAAYYGLGALNYGARDFELSGRDDVLGIRIYRLDLSNILEIEIFEPTIP